MGSNMMKHEFTKPVCLTVLPTRKCNLDCEYCKIVIPRYPQLPFDEMLQGFDNISNYFDLTLWCVLGGDIQIFGQKRMVEMTKFFEERGIFYAYVSNSGLITEAWADDLMQAGLSNWTVSMDSLEYISESTEGRESKSNFARKAIDMFKSRGLNDLHCTVTVTRTTLDKVVPLVEWLTEKGVWAEITPLIYSKNDHYDFGSSPDEMADLIFREEDVPVVKKLVNELVDMKARGYMIHNLDAYLLAWPRHIVDLDWVCSAPWNITFDSDGKLRPCLHIEGEKIREFTTLNINEHTWDEIDAAFHEDQDAQCEGCLWNCQWETQYIWEKTGSLELIDLYFAHGAKDVERAIELLENEEK